MANAITTRSPTIEGQLLEIVNAINSLENNPTTNPNNIHYINGTWQAIGDEFFYQGSFNIKASKNINEDGSLVIEPYLYLNDKTDEYSL